jgi:tyrosinase
MRRAVSRLDRSSGVPVELEDYARGFRAMSELDGSNPWSLSYQAAIHGRNLKPSPTQPDWDWCQHENWFFLPWHRMYVRQFEKILAHLINKPEWRLPYWDYSDPDETKWSLPPEFVAPADAEANALYVDQRIRTALTHDQRDPQKALETEQFAIENVTGFGFGSGRVDRPQQFGGHTGQLEGTPHNIIHRTIGGRMGNPVTAALDPIFWLHHGNIDRLWEVWIAQGNRANPTDSVWLTTSFGFPDPNGRITWRVGDVLETERLGYNYDDTTPPAPPPGPPVFARERVEFAMEEPREPELIGATADSVPLDHASTHAIEMEHPTRWKLSAQLEAEAPNEPGAFERAATEFALGRRVMLQLERVTGTDVSIGVYGVYVNVPDAEQASDHPELKAGLFSTFGLEAASAARGPGVTQAFEISGIARRLYEEGRWDPEQLRVTFDAEVLVGDVDVTSHNVSAASIRIYVL